MMYLLDTGVWLRGVMEMKSIPPPILNILAESDQIFGLSAISLWEVGKKMQIGKLKLAKDLGAWFEDALAANIQVLPLTAEVITDAMQLPEFTHRDPADELILATARIHQLTLLTTDTVLKAYKHARIRYFKPLVSQG